MKLNEEIQKLATGLAAYGEELEAALPHLAVDEFEIRSTIIALADRLTIVCERANTLAAQVGIDRH